jgi:hypothetical protein
MPDQIIWFNPDIGVKGNDSRPVSLPEHDLLVLAPDPVIE